MPENKSNLKHIHYPLDAVHHEFTGRRGGPPSFPTRNRAQHGASVRAAYDNAIASAEQEINENLVGVTQARGGYYVEFEGAEEHDLNTDSLDKNGLELLSVRYDKD